MNFVSSLTTFISDISITMDMLIILCLTEFLMLAIIGLVYLFRKNKRLKKVITKLQFLIKSKKSESSQQEQVSAYLQEQLCLSELQHETLINSKNPQEDTEKHIKVLSERLHVLNSELLTIPEYVENNEAYWPSIYARYAELTPNNEQVQMHTESVDSLDEIETIDEEMLWSLGDMEDDQTTSIISELTEEDTGTEFTVTHIGEKNTHELNIKDTANEEIGRLRDIISRQYTSIDELKGSIKDIQDLGSDTENQSINRKLSTLMEQTGTLLNEQEQLTMCIDVLEKENLRLGEEILRYQSEAAYNEKGDSQSQSLMEGLIQTNKEQLQCISILEDEISNLKNHQSIPTLGGQAKETANSKSIDEYVGTIDELKYNLTNKDSEISALRKEYATLKQKFMSISKKVANK